MSNIIKIDSKVLSNVANNNISNLIKPLQKDLLLQNIYLHEVGEKSSLHTLKKLKVGDELVLKHIPTVYDKKMVRTFDKNNEEIGIISETENEIYANLLDAGKKLKAIISHLNITFEIKIIEITIFLVDI